MKPFLVPYLVEDQSTAKGNMIVIAGGGYSSRGNAMEGYPIAEAFRDLGYNAYVLQRRVAPYNNDDIVMDMQRAVRVNQYNAESWGIDLDKFPAGRVRLFGQRRQHPHHAGEVLRQHHPQPV